MDSSRLLTCLNDDYDRLRAAVTAADPAARVPSCPDWTANDLTEHVAKVYLHKAECIRLQAFPEEWPEGVLDEADPLGTLERTHARLSEEFAAHAPTDPAATWHEPDQTVSFWIRRMAQETVIHRVDAELVAGRPLSPIPDDLALDGIDEILKLFLGYGSTVWQDEFGSLLHAPDERPVLVTAGGRGWVVTAVEGRVEVADADPATPSDARVSGEPQPLLLWLWNRTDDAAVQTSGDTVLLKQFQALRTAATQ
ncbi:maleylpyruvate isomerase family mycothiol-dependent enzyme [Nonomuraea sp. NPDC050310]|uniref:maleylpyruvate isomerase family mycothiol-dependent enzyme n=1 Tax=Nonomuraea sp. NPDC050310 TaxID=3154935 RepID=UPI0034110D4D